MGTRLRVAGKTYQNKEVIARLCLDDESKAFRWHANTKSWEGEIPDEEIDEIFERVEEVTGGECTCEFDE